MQFAFNDLLTKFDVFSMAMPRTLQDLSDSFYELEIILKDFCELVHFVNSALTFNED